MSTNGRIICIISSYDGLLKDVSYHTFYDAYLGRLRERPNRLAWKAMRVKAHRGSNPLPSAQGLYTIAKGSVAQEADAPDDPSDSSGVSVPVILQIEVSVPCL